MDRELIAVVLVILVIAGYVMLALRVLADALLSNKRTGRRQQLEYSRNTQDWFKTLKRSGRSAIVVEENEQEFLTLMSPSLFAGQFVNHRATGNTKCELTQEGETRASV